MSATSTTRSTHTPGPWALTDGGHNWSIAGPDGKGLCCCTGNVRRPDEEKSANARLIAAAPELADALRGMLAHLDSWKVVETADGDIARTRALLARIKAA